MVTWVEASSPQYIPLFCTDADIVYASPLDNLKGKTIRFEHQPYSGTVLATPVTPGSPKSIPKSLFLWDEIWKALNATPSYNHCFLRVVFNIEGSAPTYPATLKVTANYYDDMTDYSWSMELFTVDLTGPKKKVELYSAYGYMRGTEYFDLGLYIRYGTGITISVSDGSWQVNMQTFYDTLLAYGRVEAWLYRDAILNPKNPYEGSGYGGLISKSPPKILCHIEGSSEDDDVEEEMHIWFLTPLTVEIIKDISAKVFKSFNFFIDVPGCAEPVFGISDPICVPTIFILFGTVRSPHLSGTWSINGYYDIDFG